MGMLDKLSRLVVGGTAADSHDATAALNDCYIGCVQRARQLHRHAEMAPQEYSIAGLKHLATAEDAQADRLREALLAAGQAVPTVPSEPLAADARSHWGRLVQDLEPHRTSARRLRELAMHFAETLPATAGLFDELCRQEIVHCQQLRTLIARADPQAID